MDISNRRDIELLETYFGLFDNINKQSVQNMSNEELGEYYARCKAAYDYYNGMQLITKLTMNAVYGACGSVYYRFYNPRVAEDITTEGKLAMIKVDHIINNFFRTWQKSLKNARKLSFTR